MIPKHPWWYTLMLFQNLKTSEKNLRFGFVRFRTYRRLAQGSTDRYASLSTHIKALWTLYTMQKTRFDISFIGAVLGENMQKWLKLPKMGVSQLWGALTHPKMVRFEKALRSLS